MKHHILVSSCLLGHLVRYDQREVPFTDPRFLRWQQEGRFIAICPEVTGGLPTPRPPAERQGDRVINTEGADVTCEFAKGAQAALQLAKDHQISIAILKQNSPSCGSLFIYDGSFTGKKVQGEGLTAALLRQHGILVFGEDQLDEVEQELTRLEQHHHEDLSPT